MNHALRDIPPERIRLHLGWGKYEGPHHRDISLKDIFGVVLNARAQAISLKGANPRREYEWAVFQAVRLPDDNILTTGVLDSTTNFIEHPELVAQRLVRYAEVVGKENVIAGSDCGFATCARTTLQVAGDCLSQTACHSREGVTGFGAAVGGAGLTVHDVI